MKRKIYLTLAMACSMTVAAPTFADPATDNETVRTFFADIFPELAIESYVDGVYAIDENARDQWLQIEEFPPYEDAVDEGKVLFDTPFANGKSYANCFDNEGVGIKQNHPYFDMEKNKVITLELAINECLTNNGEQPLDYGKGTIAYISSYMASISSGELINVTVPDNAAAQAAYEDGKEFFYSRRGQLNMACATCHMASAGKRLRADVLSPALGHATHFPAFRSTWDDVGTIQRRYAGCNKQIRSKPLKLQSEQYRNLEYFHTYMSNGLPINGPGTRK